MPGSGCLGKSPRHAQRMPAPFSLRGLAGGGVLETSGSELDDEQKKDTNMKTNRLLAIAVAVAALAITTAARADDGVAASPKVRQRLNERKAPAPAAAAASTMACDKCTDSITAKGNPQAKGAEAMKGVMQAAITHDCSSCGTRLTVAGEGKAKHQVATHTCGMQTAPAAASCCASK